MADLTWLRDLLARASEPEPEGAGIEWVERKFKAEQELEALAPLVLPLAEALAIAGAETWPDGDAEWAEATRSAARAVLDNLVRAWKEATT